MFFFNLAYSDVLKKTAIASSHMPNPRETDAQKTLKQLVHFSSIGMEKMLQAMGRKIVESVGILATGYEF